MTALFKLVPFGYRIVALIALALAWGGWCWLQGAEHGEAKLDAYKLSEGKQSLALQTTTIAKTKALQQTKDEALNEAAKRSRIAQENLASARHDADGVRSDLADANRQLSSASPKSLRARVAALSDVFEQCAAEAAELAGHADRIAIERDTLIRAWPR